MTGQVTGSFWNTTDNVLKPKGVIDPDAQLDIPFDWSDWLADIDDTIADHEIIVTSPATVASSAEDAGVVTAFVDVNDFPVGKTLMVTCRITTANVPPRIDDRTVYLKVTQR